MGGNTYVYFETDTSTSDEFAKRPADYYGDY